MTVTEKAYAKLNLFLDVLSVRRDGFHNIKSIMHSVDLYDTVTVIAEQDDVTEITLLTDSDLPCDLNNIAVLAAKKYLDKSGITARVHIELTKRIPVSAGLGGGSSDAAAVIRALNNMFGALDREKLFELALSLGSDVPFALLGGTAICEGRGEPVTSLQLVGEMFFAIAKGSEKVSAMEAYNAIDKEFLDENGELNLPRNYYSYSSVSALKNMDEERIPIYNVFELVNVSCPESVLEIKSVFDRCGAVCSAMSGSGPSVFAIFGTKYEAEKSIEVLKTLGYFACIASSAPSFDI